MKSRHINNPSRIAPEGTRLKFNPLPDGVLVFQIQGDWKIGDPLPPVDEVEKKLRDEAPAQGVSFDTTGLKIWDSGFLTFLIKLQEYCTRNRIRLDSGGLPEGARRLLRLASSVPERKGARKEFERGRFSSLIGGKAIDLFRSAAEMIAFIGEAAMALARFFIGRANFRRSDLFLLLQECGAEALPVVSLISILFGLILGFVGAIQRYLERNYSSPMWWPLERCASWGRL